jgi:hypothetical protein
MRFTLHADSTRSMQTPLPRSLHVLYSRPGSCPIGKHICLLLIYFSVFHAKAVLRIQLPIMPHRTFCLIIVQPNWCTARFRSEITLDLRYGTPESGINIHRSRGWRAELIPELIRILMSENRQKNRPRPPVPTQQTTTPCEAF